MKLIAKRRLKLLAKLLPYIRYQNEIPASLALQAFNAASDTTGDSKRREIANKIIDKAGDYLHGRHLNGFITADITNAEVERMIHDRKIFVERARILLPPLLSLFPDVSKDNLGSVLSQIEDCCHDFPFIERAPHEKKERKERSSTIIKIKIQIKQLNYLLDQIGHLLKHEFDQHLDEINEHLDQEAAHSNANYNNFRKKLNYLSLASDIILYREARGEDGLMVSGNKAKTHIVECVYLIGIWLNGPPLVTTPGSDFSLACSLMYELATAERDASLAGAINRFSRSKRRKELDDYDREARWEDSDEGIAAHESDNFYSNREKIRNIEDTIKFFYDMMKSKNWNDFESAQLRLRIIYHFEQKQKAIFEYGPHLVWASQISESDEASRSRELREFETLLLQREIELGNARRKHRSD